jgi:hypothetical protein
MEEPVLATPRGILRITLHGHQRGSVGVPVGDGVRALEIGLYRNRAVWIVWMYFDARDGQIRSIRGSALLDLRNGAPPIHFPPLT